MKLGHGFMTTLSFLLKFYCFFQAMRSELVTASIFGMRIPTSTRIQQAYYTTRVCCAILQVCYSPFCSNTLCFVGIWA